MALLSVPKKIEGIPKLSRLESIKLFRKHKGNNVLMYQEARSRLGPIFTLYHPFLRLVIFSPEDVKHVLKDNNANYTKGPDYEALLPFIGKGLITADGPAWKKNRDILAPEFARNVLRKYVPLFTESSKQLVERWSVAAAKGELIKLHREAGELALAIASQTFFGTRMDGSASNVISSCETALDEATRRAFSPIKFPLGVPTPSNLRYRKAVERVDKQFFDLIEERRKDKNPRKDVLTRLLSFDLKEQVIRDEIVTLLMAGHETTALALTWTLYQIATRPEVARKLQGEVNQKLHGRSPLFHDLAHLAYTKQVIQESMRLFPPVPVLMRQALKGDTLSGRKIPPGTVVTLVPWSTHRDPALWAEPEKFIPERFAGNFDHGRKFHYFPFGGGPRFCIGEHFAMLELQVAVGVIIQNFELSLEPGQKISPLSRITWKPDQEILIRVRRREDIKRPSWRKVHQNRSSSVRSSRKLGT